MKPTESAPAGTQAGGLGKAALLQTCVRDQRDAGRPILASHVYSLQPSPQVSEAQLSECNSESLAALACKMAAQVGCMLRYHGCAASLRRSGCAVSLGCIPAAPGWHRHSWYSCACKLMGAGGRVCGLCCSGCCGLTVMAVCRQCLWPSMASR